MPEEYMPTCPSVIQQQLPQLHSVLCASTFLPTDLALSCRKCCNKRQPHTVRLTTSGTVPQARCRCHPCPAQDGDLLRVLELVLLTMHLGVARVSGRMGHNNACSCCRAVENVAWIGVRAVRTGAHWIQRGAVGLPYDLSDLTSQVSVSQVGSLPLVMQSETTACSELTDAWLDGGCGALLSDG
eukprot:708674-Amphidinium_carterae.1